MKSNPSMRFSKQLVGFSAELQNHAYKNLGLAAIIDIKFVPTVTKNNVRVAEVEKMEEKLKKTKSVSKIISILIEKNVLLENDNVDISITNEFYKIVEENFKTTKPIGQAVLLSLIQFVGEMNKKECHDYFKFVSYVYGLKETEDNNREFL